MLLLCCSVIPFSSACSVQLVECIYNAICVYVEPKPLQIDKYNYQLVECNLEWPKAMQNLNNKSKLYVVKRSTNFCTDFHHFSVYVFDFVM